MNFSIAEENYIKAIWRLQQGTETVSTNALAAELRTRPASVTDMLKRLHEKKILHYEPYYGAKLSNEGRKIAVHIIRRHRLWEYFLAEKLKFKWDEVHDIAEELEHISSRELIDRLDAYLNFPKTDPHGDPIPDNMGNIEQAQLTPLSQLPSNIHAVVCAVTNQSTAILEILQYKKIGIGTHVEVLQRFDFDASLEVKINHQNIQHLTHRLAENIMVKYDQGT